MSFMASTFHVATLEVILAQKEFSDSHYSVSCVAVNKCNSYRFYDCVN